MKKKSFFSKLTKCAALALVFGVVAGTGFSGVNYFVGDLVKGGQAAEDEVKPSKIQPTAKVSSVSSKDISGVVEAAMPSVVAITSMTQQEILSFFGQGRTVENESSGSGILVSKDDEYLYVATNNHVVQDSSALTVQFSDNTTAPASVRGTDPADDLAVIQVALSDLTEETKSTVQVATIGDSEKLSVGDAAIAIGNALGYGQSVTTGVISALGREVTFQDEQTGETITSRLIQTDAAINRIGLRINLGDVGLVPFAEHIRNCLFPVSCSCCPHGFFFQWYKSVGQFRDALHLAPFLIGNIVLLQTGPRNIPVPVLVKLPHIIIIILFVSGNRIRLNGICKSLGSQTVLI